MDRDERWIIVTGALVVVAGVGLGALRMANTPAPARGDAEELLASFTLAAIVATPGVLALLGRHGRPALVLPAAVTLIPLAFLSFAGVTLPLLIPAVMLAVAYRRLRLRRRGQAWRDALVAVFLVGAIITATLVLLTSSRTRTFRTESSWHELSLPAWHGSLTALAILGGAVVVGWLGAGELQSTGRDASERHNAR